MISSTVLDLVSESGFDSSLFNPQAFVSAWAGDNGSYALPLGICTLTILGSVSESGCDSSSLDPQDFFLWAGDNDSYALGWYDL